MGIVGALLVAKWSRGLIRQTRRVLLDRQAAPRIREAIRSGIEDATDDRITDLHVWSIGPGIHAAEISLVTPSPAPPDAYKARLPGGLGLVHVTVEIHRCTDPVEAGGRP